jgi:hypothetical protein
MSLGKDRKLMRNTRRSKGRNAEFYVVNVTPAAEQPAESHNGEGLATHERQHFRTLLYDDFPELLQLVNSPHRSRQWDHPIESVGPMKLWRL